MTYTNRVSSLKKSGGTFAVIRDLGLANIVYNDYSDFGMVWLPLPSSLNIQANSYIQDNSMLNDNTWEGLTEIKDNELVSVSWIGETVVKQRVPLVVDSKIEIIKKDLEIGIAEIDKEQWKYAFTLTNRQVLQAAYEVAKSESNSKAYRKREYRPNQEIRVFDDEAVGVSRVKILATRKSVDSDFGNLAYSIPPEILGAILGIWGKSKSMTLIILEATIQGQQFTKAVLNDYANHEVALYAIWNDFNPALRRDSGQFVRIYGEKAFEVGEISPSLWKDVVKGVALVKKGSKGSPYIIFQDKKVMIKAFDTHPSAAPEISFDNPNWTLNGKLVLDSKEFLVKGVEGVVKAYSNTKFNKRVEELHKEDENEDFTVASFWEFQVGGKDMEFVIMPIKLSQ